ncbi:MAG: cob(I)yrinic acid a,c-diamide adenosyltransferase [Actinobacteria bacterium]|jgi:cob(I)alamin adenosyltransferase|nr:cob(I)yrinic acid a,c-diamide adenosyltransferase [Actinomycetota bacterium]
MKSRVLLNTGTGKGKSSAAWGVMVRSWARGWKVCVVQFIKGGGWKTGERKLAVQLELEFHCMGDGFTWESDDIEATASKARSAWDLAAEKITSGQYDMVILDELTYPIAYGWLPVAEVTEVIRRRPERTNVIITGRNAPQEFIDLADTVTEMVKVKHAFDQGVKARKGIEY